MSFLAIQVIEWNVTILQPNSSSITLQWTRLDANVNHSAKFYIIEIKNIQGILLTLETIPGNTTSTEVKLLRHSTKYRVAVYGGDETGQLYKSLESVVNTTEGIKNFIAYICSKDPSRTDTILTYTLILFLSLYNKWQ